MIEVRVPAVLFGTEPRRHDDATGAVSDDSGTLQVIKRAEGTSETVAEYAAGRWVSWQALDAEKVAADAAAREAAVAEEHRTRRAEAAAREAEVAERRELRQAEAIDRAEEALEAEVGEVELVEAVEGYLHLTPGSQILLIDDESIFEVQSITGYGHWMRATVELELLVEDTDAAEGDGE